MRRATPTAKPSNEARAPRVHAESLLRVPLVAAAIAHPIVRLRARAVDRRWRYAKIVERSVTGFVPLGAEVLYASRSRTAEWLRRPWGSARALNAGDFLVREVFFLVHDFLHAWSLAAIRELAPDVVVTPRINARALEEIAFVHLATETAATVGLDYWYLGAIDLAEACDIGSTVTGLTTRYHERHLREYRRFRADLTVQDPAFLVELARFYASGELHGFDADDLAKSPRLADWLDHEVRYGETQRIYIRQWLGFLAGVPVDRAAAGRPVPWNARWQRDLVRELADRLWKLVKHGVDVTREARRAPPPARREPIGAFDARFVSVQAIGLEEALRHARTVTDPAHLALLCDQITCAFDFARFDRRLMPALLRARAANDPFAVHAVLQRGPRVPPEPSEPREIFLPN